MASNKFRIPNSSAQDLFEAVHEEGVAELARPAGSLWWSGIAAGVAMSTSVVGRAVFERALPEAPWAHLVASFGYTYGFVIVVLGHMQLFTENTITTLLPVLKRRDLSSVVEMLRLWTIVLGANLVGAAVAGLMVHQGVFSPALVEAMVEVSRHGTGWSPSQSFLQGIPAGFLVAALVWTSRLAQGQRLLIIVMLSWLIAASDATHVIAGTVEVFLLVFHDGPIALGLLWRFTVPCLFGNVVGGSLLFALMAYAQVSQELD